MGLNKGIVLLITILAGLILPFIPFLTVIEMFFLLIPFAIIFIVTSVYLMISLLKKNVNRRKAIFTFSILPVFLMSQLVSGLLVDKIQRYRSERVINEIVNIRNQTGELPEHYESSLGIKYSRLKDKSSFVISYSRGFMVTEKYDSKDQAWRSYGWND